ncbi:feruloyl esterase-like protein B [Pyrenochaeta sp. MPI-SDFR-AT-0127]|nr:feruloyl esterase-like protein B [Pyrenochaeta sp. MPI-SDFR-AT-0127]
MRFEQSVWAALLSVSSVFANVEPTGRVGNSPKPNVFNSKCAATTSRLATYLSNSTVHFSEFIAAGTNLSLPENSPTCGRPFMLVTADICRIALAVSTSERSGFTMEAWLPSNWTGRFLSTGNGGLSGCIQYQDLAYASALGFAAVGNNNGHNGTSGEPFNNNSGVVEDFAYRALHTGVVIGKRITKHFYGKPHKKSYYLGCSTGGRQGFKSAQTFPDDFDGIIAGAPALAFNSLVAWSGNFYSLTGPPTSPKFVTRALWLLVHRDVLKQCDALDGLVDGVIEDPSQCNYDPSGLICSEGTGGNSTTCLTPIQAETVKSVYKPLFDDRGGLIYPGLQPGGEVVAAFFMLHGAPFIYTTEWFRYVVYDPSWDPETLNMRDYETAIRLNPFNIQTWEGDLSRVRKRGTKVLHWHGLMDGIITSGISPQYYEHVSSTMRLSPAELDKFYRYFPISGAGHCFGGDGAHAIGQAINEVNSYHPSENILMALVDWVENSNPPETLIGTRWVNNTQSLGVDYQRAHCKYPKRNQYKGKGNSNVLSSWECVDP